MLSPLFINITKQSHSTSKPFWLQHFKKIAWKGDRQTDTHTDTRTSRLLERIGPVGRFVENLNAGIFHSSLSFNRIPHKSTYISICLFPSTSFSAKGKIKGNWVTFSIFMVFQSPIFIQFIKTGHGCFRHWIMGISVPLKIKPFNTSEGRPRVAPRDIPSPLWENHWCRSLGSFIRTYFDPAL